MTTISYVPGAVFSPTVSSSSADFLSSAIVTFAVTPSGKPTGARFNASFNSARADTETFVLTTPPGVVSHLASSKRTDIGAGSLITAITN